MSPVRVGGSEQINSSQPIRYRDRRSARRYEIRLGVRWKQIYGKRVLDSGHATTVNFSSSGILLKAGHELSAGATVELSIAWPARLRNAVSLQLMVVGEIVRASKKSFAIRMLHHEYRTVGSPPLRGARTRACRVETRLD